MEVNDLIKKKQINAINGFSIDPFIESNKIVFLKKIYKKEWVQDYMKRITKCNENRLLDSLKFVNLNTEICKRDISTLSASEQIKIELAIALIDNREVIILFSFDTFFITKELEYFKKLFKKLVNRYAKTIVLIDSNLNFLLNIVDRLVLCTDKKEVKVFNKNEIYSNELEEYMELPPIISFTKYVNKTKKNIGQYTDLKELIKAIYREV